MSVSLYDALVPSFQQLLGSMSHLLAKAEAHCDEHGLAHEALIGARLYDDMLPFSYQVKSTAEHSIGAIESVRTGVYSPSLAPPPDSFAALHEKVDGAKAALAALDPAEIDGFVGRDMRFEFRDRRIDFTAENFLLSFAQPNFYFHASTAYGVLRTNGVKLGKSDFMGRPRARG
jgi:uncharacterized protein